LPWAASAGETPNVAPRMSNTTNTPSHTNLLSAPTSYCPEVSTSRYRFDCRELVRSCYNGVGVRGVRRFDPGLTATDLCTPSQVRLGRSLRKMLSENAESYEADFVSSPTTRSVPGDLATAARDRGDHADPPHRLRDAHVRRRRLPQGIQRETGLKPEWPAEAFDDLDENVRQSIARIKASRSFRRPTRCAGFLATVLFLDVAGSTERVAEIGDRSWDTHSWGDSRRLSSGSYERTEASWSTPPATGCARPSTARLAGSAAPGASGTP